MNTGLKLLWAVALALSLTGCGEGAKPEEEAGVGSSPTLRVQNPSPIPTVIVPPVNFV